MSEASNYLENALANHVFRNSAMSSPATVYLSLYTDNPAEDDSGTEVSGGSYARQAVTFGAPSNGVVTNSGDITFPTATGNWGTVSHFGIHDASTAGNLLAYSALDSSKTIETDDVFKVLSGNLSVSIA